MDGQAQERIRAMVRNALDTTRALLAASRACEVPTCVEVTWLDPDRQVIYRNQTWLARLSGLQGATERVIVSDVERQRDMAISHITDSQPHREIEPYRVLKVGNNAHLLIVVGGQPRVDSVTIAACIAMCFAVSTLGDVLE